MGGDWLEFRSDLVFVFVGFVGVAVSVLVLVRIFSGGGWLVGLVVSGDIFFFGGNFGGEDWCLWVSFSGRFCVGLMER